ncbi:MAG: hypothetical protein ACTSW1_01385, partial [Candidatus Hodarchaeales archaeon]
MNNLKIISASVKNFQGIEAREVDFGGRSAIIIGKPGSGKSSLINAIMSPIHPKYIPREPVKQGEEKGSVEVIVAGEMGGKETTYTLNIYFNAGSNKGEIVITDGNHGKIPKTKTRQILNSLFENIGFDIMEFIELGKTDTGAISTEGSRKQIEVIKSLMDQTSANKLDDIDEKKKLKVEKRTEKNRDIKEAKASLEHQPYSQKELVDYAEKVSTEEITKEFDTISEMQTAWDSGKKTVDDWPGRKLELEKKIEDANNELIKQETILKSEQAQNVTYKKYLKAPRPSATDVQERLNKANTHNQNVDSVTKYKVKLTAMNKVKEEVKVIDADIKKLGEDKLEIFTSASFPVKGLTFEDNLIMMGGIPLEQINTASLMAIGIHIQILKNPNLKTMIVKTGSLLDD